MLSRDQLLDLARGRAANALDRSIDTQVSRLRRKLELDPSDPKIIKTVWGGGYMFTPAVSQRMSRFLPRSLFGQTLLILLAGPDRIPCGWLVDLHRGPRAGRARRRRICNRPAHRQSHPLGPGHTARNAATHCRRVERSKLPRLTLGPAASRSQSVDDDASAAEAINGFSGRSTVSWIRAPAARVGVVERTALHSAPWHDDGARPDDARLRWLRRLSGSASRDSPGGWTSGFRLRPPCRQAALRFPLSSCSPWASWQ